VELCPDIGHRVKGVQIIEMAVIVAIVAAKDHHLSLVYNYA